MCLVAGYALLLACYALKGCVASLLRNARDGRARR